MNYSACFRSLARPELTFSLDQVIYRCPESGSLLEVSHDMQALKQRSSSEWRKLFDERYRSIKFPDNSGVWSKREWVLPQVRAENIVSLGEGYSQLFVSEKLNKLFGQRELYVKLCGNSHTGSFKDLGMTVLVSQVKQMIADGSPIKAVACASTGDTSAALAAYTAHANIPSVILLPHNKISLAQLIQPVSNGALVLALDTDFDGCMKIVQQLTLEKEIYLANSMNSLRIEGQKTVGIEVVQQLAWQVPDWFIIPGGNLGNVSALGSGLWMLQELGLIDRLPRLAVAQAQAANPLYLSYLKNFTEFQPVTAQPTQASAIRIGNPVSIDKAIRTLKQFNGVVEQASEAELAEAAAKADLSGLLCDPHTGVALAALEKLQKNKVIAPDDTVVIISTANGLKFTDFKVQYHENRLPGVTARHPNKTLILPPTLSDVKRAVEQHLTKHL